MSFEEIERIDTRGLRKRKLPLAQALKGVRFSYASFCRQLSLYNDQSFIKNRQPLRRCPGQHPHHKPPLSRRPKTWINFAPWTLDFGVNS